VAAFSVNEYWATSHWLPPPFAVKFGEPGAGEMVTSLALQVTHGTAIPATIDMPPHMWAFNAGIGTTGRNVAQAKRAYATVQRLLARDVPLVYLWWPMQIEVTNDDLKGFRPNAIVDTWNAYEWSI
jgi:hypothetical protein